MSYFTQWELYGKDAHGQPIAFSSAETLRSQLEKFSDEWHTDGNGGELICAFMTDYRSAYQKVVEAVAEFSQSLPDSTFLLDYNNTDSDFHQHVHIRNGEREELDGYIAYEPPKMIPYDSSSKPRLFIVLEAGSVQGVFADGLDAEVTIVDRDLHKLEGCAPGEARAAAVWVEEKLRECRNMKALYGSAYG